jgi:predicted MPP superfamily phosphohydrolase
MCKKPKRLRRAVGRGRGYSRLRGLNESFLKPFWERFPTERLAHRLTPPAVVTAARVELAAYDGPPLRIAFLSDLHAGPTTATSLLTAAIARVATLAPDVVLLGGDYVYFDADNLERIAAPLAHMAARYPTYGIWGNHDLWADDAYLGRRFASLGVQMLRNQWARSLAGFPIDLYGVDDPWTGEPDFAPLAGAARPVILLCHNPDGLLLMQRAHRADLMLCGHTHGGQVCRRDGRPYFVHAKTGTRFAGGRYEYEGRQLVVSKGLGTVEVPVRRHAPPEIVSVDVAAAPRYAGSL